MPELPEVETIRCGLQEIRHKKIVAVKVHTDTIVRPKNIAQQLRGRKFIEIKRRGKLLIFSLDNHQTLLVHLKMTGQLVLRQVQGKMFVGGHPIVKVVDVPNKFTHVEFLFADKSVLFFNDVRRFGYIKLVDSSDLPKITAGYGPEPLTRELTLKRWLALMAKKKQWSVKKFLLDQSVIAGLGNIYADEACFYTGIRPMRLVGSLAPAQQKTLLANIRMVLRLSLKHGGTSFNTYVQAAGHQGIFLSLLKVYGRAGQLCKKCKKNRIVKIRFAGRGTHYCPQCQK